MNVSDFIDLAKSGDIDSMERFISSGFDADSVDESGDTALIAASSCGMRNVVLKLLSCGVDVDIKDANGLTAILRSISSGHMDIASILAASGASFEGVEAALSDNKNEYDRLISNVETVRLKALSHKNKADDGMSIGL